MDRKGHTLQDSFNWIKAKTKLRFPQAGRVGKRTPNEQGVSLWSYDSILKSHSSVAAQLVNTVRPIEPDIEKINFMAYALYQ